MLSFRVAVTGHDPMTISATINTPSANAGSKDRLSQGPRLRPRSGFAAFFGLNRHNRQNAAFIATLFVWRMVS